MTTIVVFIGIISTPLFSHDADGAPASILTNMEPGAQSTLWGPLEIVIVILPLFQDPADTEVDSTSSKAKKQEPAIAPSKGHLGAHNPPPEDIPHSRRRQCQVTHCLLFGSLLFLIAPGPTGLHVARQCPLWHLKPLLHQPYPGASTCSGSGPGPGRCGRARYKTLPPLLATS